MFDGGVVARGRLGREEVVGERGHGKRAASDSVMDIWQWTLTKDAIAPCFVRDVLDMRQSSDSGACPSGSF